MKIHPFTIIMIGLLCCSIGFNVCFWQSNVELVSEIQRLESRPLIQTSEEKEKSKIMSDEEINDLIKQILKKMAKERTV